MSTQTKKDLTNRLELFAEQQQVEQPSHSPKEQEAFRIAVGRHGDNQVLYYLTTDNDSGYDAQNRAAAWGFALEIRGPIEGLPPAAHAVIVALDELLLDRHGRDLCLAQLLTGKRPPYPTIVLSHDFIGLNVPLVVHPGLALAVHFDDILLRALQRGHFNLPTDEGERHKAA